MCGLYVKNYFYFQIVKSFFVYKFSTNIFCQQKLFSTFFGGRVKPCFGHGSYIERLIAMAYYIDSLRRKVENVLFSVILARSNTSKGQGGT